MYAYQDSLSLFENEAVAGGIATCETYNEFLHYYRMLAYHGRPGESYRHSQKRAAALWRHVRTFRENYTPPSTPTPDEAEESEPTEENICPICCEKKPAADEEGHCSYECASGGGKSEKPEQAPAAQKVEEDDDTLKEDMGSVGVTIAIFMALGYWLAMIYYGATSWSR
jgi:hypothetical protein